MSTTKQQPSGGATLAQQRAERVEPDAFVPREAIRTLSGGANHVPATLTLNDDGGKAVAVFLSPQPAQRKPLTDEEIDLIVAMSCKKDSSHLDAARVARAIEAAHGIKENT